MPLNAIIFNSLQGLICLYAFWRGGGPERLAGLLLVLAAAVTYFALPYQQHATFHDVFYPLLVVDVLLLGGLIMLALVANRFWPLWIAALHLMVVAVHGVKAYQPDLLPWIYAFATGKAAYFMIALLLIGTARHRWRLRHYGRDPDWSFARR